MWVQYVGQQKVIGRSRKSLAGGGGGKELYKSVAEACPSNS